MTTKVALGRPQEFGPIEVWPLLQRHQSLTGFIGGLRTLDVSEAIEPDPNQLLVTNKGSEVVFLPMGFLIGGLQQSRMIAEDLVIPVGLSIEIPVMCVEVGRFSNCAAPRAAGRAPLSVMNAGIQATDVGRRQEEVWASVRTQEHRSGRRPTHSLEQVMVEDRKNREYQRRIDEQVTREFLALPHQIGFVATAGGEPIVMEMFGSAALAREYIPDLIRGLAFDVDGYESFPSTPERVMEFLSDARAVKFQCSTQPSGTTRIQGANGRVHLQGIWVESRTYIHVMATNSRHPVMSGV